MVWVLSSQDVDVIAEGVQKSEGKERPGSSCMVMRLLAMRWLTSSLLISSNSESGEMLYL